MLRKTLETLAKGWQRASVERRFSMEVGERACRKRLAKTALAQVTVGTGS